MFSERYRTILLIGLYAVMFLLCLYSYYFAYSDGHGHLFEKKPPLPDGRKPLKLGFAEVGRIWDDGAVLLFSGERQFKTEPIAERLKQGELVSISGYLMPDGRVAVESMVIHRTRWIKKLVSIIVTLFVLFLLLTRFRISWQDRLILGKD